MKAFVIGSLGVALAAVSAPLSATILTFDAGVACGAVTCTDSAAISQTYGDSTFVDVSYVSRLGPGESDIVADDAFYWSDGYADLHDVIYAGFARGHVLEIMLVVRGGGTLTLNSFDIGGYQRDLNSAVRVYQLGRSRLELLDYDVPVSGTLSKHQVFQGFSTSEGFILQIGQDGYYAGIDNLDFSATAGVPEPASWALMIAGFGMTGASLRRRRVLAA